MQKDFPYSLIRFYATSRYPCSYFLNRQARSQVVAPAHLVDKNIYSGLVNQGFRRSGIFTYRPHCDDCQACIPARIPVMDFRPDRSQRRAVQKHACLQAIQKPLVFEEEHFALYQRYQSLRHNGGGMDDDDREQYSQFLLQSHVDTLLIEFREQHVLRMVSIIDRLNDGLSSVYTFYQPDRPGSSYGTYNILWQIEACLQLHLPYLYLGYWIEQNRKMSYKIRFRPVQLYQQGQWHIFTP